MRTSIPTCSAAAMPTSITATSAGAPSRSQAEDRKSTRLNSSHTVIYTLSLHDALPIFRTLIDAHVHSDMFRRRYADVYHGDERWRSIEVTGGATYGWPSESTYIQNPPYFTGMTMTPVPPGDIERARALAAFGDSITTDHISPAGAIKPDSPAGRFLVERGVPRGEFNSYGARRGNHEVMMRGTFANIRIRNRMTPEIEGGVTKHYPSGEVMPIYDAAMKYQTEGRACVVFAGKEYGTGSSRDWAAKGAKLLGVR